MFLRELSASLDHIKGVGPELKSAFTHLGVTSVGGLLCYYPRDWEDRNTIVPIGDFQRATVCTQVRVIAHDWFGFGAMKTLKIHVEDTSGRGVLVCFKRPFLENQLVVGNQYWLWGTFFYKYGEIQSTNFEVEAIQGGTSKNFAHLVPVYRLSAKLKAGTLRRCIKQALDQYAGPLENELPDYLIERRGLFSKSRAIRAIHFPTSVEELNVAKQTLVYEELFYLEMVIVQRMIERRRAPGEQAPDAPMSSLQKRLIERLPFSLTQGQVAALADINRDIDSPYPMARLIQGDVGSGKTLVSFLAALRAAETGGQAALMAPTELLARQHAENAARLLEPLGLRPAFLTGNIKSSGRAQLLKNLALGQIDFIIGTHALFSRDVHYRNLRLVVIDEQHRFGVLQRQAIVEKGDQPDLLMMSATPIPRTLALTVFGDMDVSIIRDMPLGRKPVITHLALQSNEMRVYDFVRQQLAAGRQAYFVYPLIDADENKSLKDAESMALRLSEEIFPEYDMSLIHSKLNEEEKRITMENFRKGVIRMLVATSVVEVGVDVPNATCMVIEHAERFGLSALHQLRGRVGRGNEQSYCFLVYTDDENNHLSDDSKDRLKVMKNSTDGFVIAEEDLRLRGPGQIAGIEQSGNIGLSIADLIRDIHILEHARTDAFAMLELDPELSQSEHHCVAQVLKRAPPFANVAL
ncbi:MAG: ATP-dependent DNA helicase RecG [Treponema sp.]|jgi:ATP-dependent DNA helicase RecG|nr:ATP-dependent DNA helicase RecG [Treponema sp.]